MKMRRIKEKQGSAKTTGFVATKTDFFESDVFIRYSESDGFGTLSIGNGKDTQFSVSYEVVKKVVAQAR